MTLKKITTSGEKSPKEEKHMSFKKALFTAAVVGFAVSANASDHGDHEGVHFGGYVDAQFNWVNGTDGGQANVNQFAHGEGALYLGKNAGDVEVFVDVPLTASTSTTGTTTVSNGLQLNGAQAQAYVGMKMDNGFSWRLGKFDTHFNYEAKDSHERTFVKEGFLSNGSSVSSEASTVTLYNASETHTGLRLGYDVSDVLTVHGYIANLLGLNGTGLDGNYEFGLHFAATMDNIDLHLAGSFAEILGETAFLIDFVAASTFDMFSVGLFGVYGDLGQSNSEASYGVGLDLGYDIDEMASIGARVEYGSDAAENTAFQVTVGPQVELDDDFVLRADYTLTSISLDTGSDPDSKHEVHVGAVYSF